MYNSLEEAVQLFTLNDSQLIKNAQNQALLILQNKEYDKYDAEFKQNFVDSFVTTFVQEVTSNRENMAYTLLQNNYPKEIILKAGRITPKQLDEMDLKTNTSNIISQLLNNKNQ